MEDISSILASFDIKKITEQYCDDLRSQRKGKLVKKEREKLEHTIRNSEMRIRMSSLEQL